MLRALIPAVLLALLLVAPRKGGGRPGPAARAAAVLVLIWSVISVGVWFFWNEFGLGLLLWSTVGVE